MLPTLRRRGYFPSFSFGQDDPDSVFSRFFGDFEDVFGDHKYTDKDGNLVVEIEVPGFSKENLQVEISDGLLSVIGERKIAANGHTKKIHKRFTISNTEEVDAEVKDGILTLVFREPEKKKTKIDVK